MTVSINTAVAGGASGSGTVDAAGVLTAMQDMNATQEAQARDAIQAAPVVNSLALVDGDFTSNNLDLTSSHENMLLDLSAVTIPVTLTWQTDAAGGYTTTGPVAITVYNGGTAPAAIIAGSGATLVGGPQVIEQGGWGGLYRTGANEATCEGATRTALPAGPALLSNGFSLILPNGAATAGVTALCITNVGNTLDSSTAVGAGSTDGTAPYYNRARNQYNTAAAAINRSTGFNSTSINADVDNAGGRFPMTIAGAIADAIATAPFLMGITASSSFTTTISSTEPSAATGAAMELIAIGADSADTNLSLFHNDNAGTATKIDLGASFPKSQYVLYELTVFKNDAGTAFLALVRNVNTGAATAIPLVSNIPRSTVTMQFVLARSSWASATTASVQFAYQATGFRP